MSGVEPGADMADSDVNAAATISLLDMGRQIYGDCLLVQMGGKTILIDGGHPADFEGQEGVQSIPEQLGRLLRRKPPFKISLLVVTHCHNDHIGCLPELVSNSVIEPEWALATDEKLGFGRAVGESSPLDSLSPEARSLVSALQEEDHSAVDDGELARFLADAGKVEPRYKAMLSTLKQRGTRVVRHGRDDERELVRTFASVGLEILGPTQDQLLICSEIIARTTTDAVDAVRQSAGQDADVREAYRRMMTFPTGIDLLDRPGRGAAFNNQSIVLKLGRGDRKMLVAGDMQFALPEVPGLDVHMARLRSAVKAAGPYRFIKASHHTSYNGIDESVWKDFGNPTLIGHSGGSNDSSHPDRRTLGVLKGLSRSFKYARTDRNGLVTVGPDGFTTDRGRLNDFTPNAGRDFEVAAAGGRGGGSVNFAQTEGIGSGKTSEVQSPAPPSGGAIDFIYMRIPHRSGRFSVGDIPVSFDFAPPSPRVEGAHSASTFSSSREAPDVQRAQPGLAGGRALPKLLFATSRAALGQKLGEEVADQVARIVQDGGQTLCDVPDAANLQAEVARRLSADSSFRGVVLLGGYDVLPSQRVDVLDPPLRQGLGGEVYTDPDNFVVWSDDFYADLDGDGIAERPVSRIPDGGSAALLISCLTGATAGNNGRFGIRNSARPFADSIWSSLPGNGAILVSGPAQSSALSIPSTLSHVYLMLHGDFTDSSRFWGEDQGLVEAINVGRLPSSLSD